MSNIDPFILNSKIDIPFFGAQIGVHQPSIREIALIGGQDVLFPGCELFRISAQDVIKNDKVDSDNIKDFDILMQILITKPRELTDPIHHAQEILKLLFPGYRLELNPPFEIQIIHDDSLIKTSINRKNYNEFQDIISQMFKMSSFNNSVNYNPQDPMAQRIVNQLKERQRKLAELRGEGNVKSSIFDRYISILSVGLQKDKNQLMEYSVYQLFDEFERYQAKVAFDMYVSAKMAGADKLEEVENWMRDLHVNKN